MSGQRQIVLDPRLAPATSQSLASHASQPAGAVQSSSQPHHRHILTSASRPPEQPSAAASTGSEDSQVDPAEDSILPEQHESPGGHGEHDAGKDSKRPPHTRACEACRGLKVRCDQDPLRPDIPCRRCAKAGRQCIVTQPSRKRQKKTDSRVAELEKKLDALTAVLHQHGAPGQQAMPHAGSAPSSAHMLSNRYSAPAGAHANLPPSYPPSIDSPVLHQSKRRRAEGMAEGTESIDGPDMSTTTDSITRYTPADSRSGQSHVHGTPQFHEYVDSAKDNLTANVDSSPSPEDTVDRINNLVTPDMATTIFRRYLRDLMPRFPAVVLSLDTTAEQLCKDKPILYICILSVSSSGLLHPDTSRLLTREAVGIVADCVVRYGTKSLELIQAMQVMALWYRPPENGEQSTFYQIIHMAAVMALDIGLGKRFNPVKARRGFSGQGALHAPCGRPTLPQDSDTLEARRAWLTCYYLCASASMVLRRPNLIRWTNYMRECIEVLGNHPDAYASDKLLCQHVKIHKICEDIGQQFLMDDSSANVSITDPKVSHQLNVLEDSLKMWKQNIPSECRVPELQFFEHVTSLYLHEIALHFNHNVDDFRLPFTEESLKTVNSTSDILTQNQMAALEACRKAAHGILDTMLSFDIQVVRSLPPLIFFVRCTYAVVILIKMHVAISTPGSELGKIMKFEDLRVDHYIDSLISMFNFVSQQQESQPHLRNFRVIGRLKGWFLKHKENIAAQSLGGKPSDSVDTASASTNDLADERSLILVGQMSRDTSEKQAKRRSADGQPRSDEQADWTFNTPYTFGPPPLGRPDQRFPLHPQRPGGPREMPDPPAAGQDLALDPSSSGDYWWGNGFEQAMDITMGATDGLRWLDDWLVDDSMAPSGSPGDMSAQQWQ